VPAGGARGFFGHERSKVYFLRLAGTVYQTIRLGKLWRTAGQAGRQSQVRRRWHEAEVHFGGEGVGDPAEPRDGGVGDRKRPVERDTQRQVDAQGDGGGGEGVAANHPAAGA